MSDHAFGDLALQFGIAVGVFIAHQTAFHRFQGGRAQTAGQGLEGQELRHDRRPAQLEKFRISHVLDDYIGQGIDRDAFGLGVQLLRLGWRQDTVQKGLDIVTGLLPRHDHAALFQLDIGLVDGGDAQAGLVVQFAQ